jgi:hypothetical protein
MNNPAEDATAGAPRRTLFGRVAAGAMALGIAGFAAPSARADTPADGPDWPGKLTGRHRQAFDGYTVNGGSVLLFAHTFLATGSAPGTSTAVVILRAEAAVLATNDSIWDNYKLGDSLRITDPETKAAAVKNPFLHPKPAVLRVDAMAVDRLLADGAILGVCNVALHGMSHAHAAAAGVSAEDAYKDWAANLGPGITILPSGVWGVNRAQEAGCTYCAGG